MGLLVSTCFSWSLSRKGAALPEFLQLQQLLVFLGSGVATATAGRGKLIGHAVRTLLFSLSSFVERLWTSQATTLLHNITELDDVVRHEGMV